MALTWLVTSHLTGRVLDGAVVDDPSLTTDFDRSTGSASIRIGHMIRADGTLDLPRATRVATYVEPPGAHALACLDMEPDAGFSGQFDRVIGEWQIRGGTPQTGETGVPVTLGGLLESTGDRLLEHDYKAEGYASWIVSDLLRECLTGVTVDIPKPAVGPIIPVDWRAGHVTYAQAISDVQDASGLEVMVRYGLELASGAPSRITRAIVFGAPIRVLNDQRTIEVGGANGISVARPTSIGAWANSVNVYGSGSGDDQVAGNAARGKPAGMPIVTRSFSHPDVASTALANAMAAQHLGQMTGVEPLQVTALRRNWTNKYPVLGDAHRVIVNPCLAFPDGIDGIYRITRISYRPDDSGLDTVQLIMEVSP